ncbi:hypothetical protein WJX75_009637 [Coccomyxa subellipsoidea]|uniref:Polymerase nucleotidyl transferase domain-containing protein n=1 Tax=Coccomyxa subellipsoidea TaxID=248742 RepID=A0ABR2YZ57_9CHLO
MQASRRSANLKAEAPQNLVSVEERVEELVQRIKPNHISDRRRKEVGSYVKDLIKRCFLPAQQVEAYMFGSVPLKTYLPDGDIDLAVFQGKGPRLRDVWTYELSALLEAEGRNSLNPHRVKDVQIINAEVKLLKCLVDNIVVDISFDTLGGLCTVAFLESIDRHIGKQHLFKRSVILVKAWCYYESRLLGAHHGLLSTYALETMVLYIFNMYHHELQSPLKVLRKFLDVFSKFDWDAHALSLQGPIPLASFPDPQVEPVAGAEGGTLLRGDVLKAMLEMYSPRVQQRAGKAFAIKNMNIVDSLLPINNLGRSVNKASKARIRKALAHGSHMLNSIFDKVGQDAIDAVDNFFRNTWNAQRTQLPSVGRLHPDGLAQVASFCRPLMVPAAMSHVPSQPRSAESQAFHPAYLLAYAPTGHAPAAAGVHDANGNGAMELGRAGRAFSGPLPERPLSSASNMSANSEPQGPSSVPAGAEAWPRGHPAAAHVQSVLANGGGAELRRSESGRAGPNGLDPGGHGGHHKRDNGNLNQGHFEGPLRSNGLVSMPVAGQEQMLPPMYAYALHGVAYPVPLQPGNLHLRYHAPALPAFGPTLSLPNGRVYHQQQPILPASSGLMYQRPALQSSVSEGGPSAEAQGKDLLEGDLLTLSQHLTVARRCHSFVISEDSTPGTSEQHPQNGHPAPQQPPSHHPPHLRTSHSQLGLDQHRPAHAHGARQGGHQRGTGGTRRDNAAMNNRQRGPPRSNSADNLDAEAAQSSSGGRSLGTAQEPGTPVPRPADMAPSLPRTETSAYAVGHTQPSPVRTLADASPAGSAAQTPVADSKPTSPSYSATSTPVTATAGKRVWAGNSAGLLQSAGNSPAGWSNRPDAKAALGARQHSSDAGGTSRSEGSSPMAGNAKGAVWPTQPGQTAWRGTPPSAALGSSPSVKR